MKPANHAPAPLDLSNCQSPVPWVTKSTLDRVKGFEPNHRTERKFHGLLRGGMRTGLGVLAALLMSCSTPKAVPPIDKVVQGDLSAPAPAEFAPAGLAGIRLGYSNQGWDCEYKFFQDGKYRYAAVGDRKKESGQLDGWTTESASTDVRSIATNVTDGITKAGVGADVWDLTAIRIAEEGAEPEQYSVDWAAESGIARIERYCDLTRRYWWFDHDGVVIGPDSFYQMSRRMGGAFR